MKRTLFILAAAVALSGCMTVPAGTKRPDTINGFDPTLRSHRKGLGLPQDSSHFGTLIGASVPHFGTLVGANRWDFGTLVGARRIV